MEIGMPLAQKCVRGLMELVLEGAGHALIYTEFCANEPKLKGTSFEAFSAEYIPAKLALGCAYWVDCCAHHRIEDKALRNLYFKEVMKIFESPKSLFFSKDGDLDCHDYPFFHEHRRIMAPRSLENATRFSESLYASNADPEQSPVLGILVHLFQKLGLEAFVKTGTEDEDELSPGFHFMTEVSEALKVVFERQFEDFYDAQEGLCRKKGAV